MANEHVLKSNQDTELPSQEKVTCKVPPRMIFLGEGLKPVAKVLRKAIARKVISSGPEFVTIEDISRHMGVIGQGLTHLSSWLAYLTGSFIKDEKAGMSEAYRAAGRLEQVLSEFVDGYYEVKASHANSGSSEARALLLGVYRHHLRDICDWIEELVQVTANPMAAIQKLGIPSSDNVKLTVVLNMSSPPEMVKLHVLAQRLQRPIGLAPLIEQLPTHHAPQSSSPGVFGTIGALAFGIGITRAFFRRNHGQS